MKLWRTRPFLDLIPALALGFLAWVCWDAPADVLIGFITAVGALSGILAAVVTFACTAAYSSNSLAFTKVRSQAGGQMRRFWVTSIGIIVASAAVSVGAFVLIGSILNGLAGALGVAAFTASLGSTARALSWLSLVWKAEDDDAARFQLPEHLKAPSRVVR